MSESASMRLPILQLSCRLFFFGKTSHHPGLLAPLQPRFGFLRLLALPKANIAVEREEICECDGHTVHQLSQQRLTADWLAPRESACLRMRSKVSSDWLSSYIKATRPVLEIFKMAKYFPDSPHTLLAQQTTRRHGSEDCCLQSLFSAPRTSLTYHCYITVQVINTRSFQPTTEHMRSLSLATHKDKMRYPQAPELLAATPATQTGSLSHAPRTLAELDCLHV